MNSYAQHFDIVDGDPETGSAIALLLTAAGYEVETDFVDGVAFINADALDPEILFDGGPESLARQLRARLDEATDEIEIAELRSEFRNPAA